jgi:hypothetical protein
MAMPPLDKSLQGLLKDHDFRLALLERRLGGGGTGGGGGSTPNRLGGPTGDLVTLGPGVDLNTVRATGWYIQNPSANATLALNYPVARSGHLEVSGSVDANDYVLQTYTEYLTNQVGQPPREWRRTYYNGTWQPWTLTTAPPLPAPIRYATGTVHTVTSTTVFGAILPGTAQQSMTIDRPLWVLITYGGWVIASAGETRGGVAVGGATALAPHLNQSGDAVWGQVLLGTATVAATGSSQVTGTKLVLLNPGTNTFQLEAYLATAGTHQWNYPVLEVTPLSWADVPVPVKPTNGALTRRASIAAQNVLTTPVTILYGESQSNSGHFTYNATTGAFTCAVPGTYRITSTAGFSTATAGYGLHCIRVNGDISATIIIPRSTSNQHGVAVVSTVVLALGDTVDTFVQGAVANGQTDITIGRTFIELVPVVVDAETGSSGLTDTGWVDIAVQSGFGAQGNGEQPQVRRIGSVVYARGGWSGTGIVAANTSYTQVGVIPEGFRPVVNRPMRAGTNAGAVEASIIALANGNVDIRTGATLSPYYFLPSPSWPID